MPPQKSWIYIYYELLFYCYKSKILNPINLLSQIEFKSKLEMFDNLKSEQNSFGCSNNGYKSGASNNTSFKFSIITEAFCSSLKSRLIIPDDSIVFSCYIPIYPLSIVVIFNVLLLNVSSSLAIDKGKVTLAITKGIKIVILPIQELDLLSRNQLKPPLDLVKFIISYRYLSQQMNSKLSK
ncbi:UNKNOWN [Stylonychia lemnae]|uniref:Uncharacterized protein n=1 Tax=Stylonychia lemnae TaxID=5949 RepID=A0A078B8X3_STYLE|nr:UNKNOWN [Stylonychia lemnae]|eukprot:CDW89993.1 UNKNOWN [Stylonychia lemnae]